MPCSPEPASASADSAIPIGAGGHAKWITALVAATLLFHLKVVLGHARFPYDFEGYHFPLLFLNARLLGSGELPGYNPFVYAGIPYFNNVQAGFWYPPNFLFALLTALQGGPTLAQAQYLNLFHFALGAAGSFLLLRKWSVAPPAAFAGGLLYLANGHVLAQAQHLGVIETMAWLPCCLLATRCLWDSPSYMRAAALGTSLAMPMLIGFLPLALALYVVIGLAILHGLFFSRSEWKQKLGTLLWTALIAAGWSAPVTIPVISTWDQAVALGHQGTMPPRMLLTLFIPNIFGQFDPPHLYRGIYDSTIDYFYTGVASLGIAAAALFLASGRARYIMIASILCGFIAFGPQIVSDLCHAIPIAGPLIRPFMFAYPMVLFAILAISQVVSDRSKMGWLIGCAATGVVGAFWLAVFFTSKSGLDWATAARVGGATLAATVFAFAAPAGIRRYALPLLMVLDPLTVNFGRNAWNQDGAPNVHSPTTVDRNDSPLLTKMRAPQEEPFRVAVDQERLTGPWNGYWPVWRIESINGFDPFLPAAYFNEIKTHLATWHTDRLFNPGRLDDPLFELLNVRYLLTDRILESRRWKLAMVDGRYRLYEYDRFTPRYRLVPNDTLTFDSVHFAESIQPNRPTENLGFVTQSKRSLNRIEIHAAANANDAFLIISERAYPEWHVRVDNSVVTPVTVNRLVMGVPLTQGRHEIVLEYVPRGLHFGFVGAAVAACLCIAGLLLKRRNDRGSVSLLASAHGREPSARSSIGK